MEFVYEQNMTFICVLVLFLATNNYRSFCLRVFIFIVTVLVNVFAFPASRHSFRSAVVTHYALTRHITTIVTIASNVSQSFYDARARGPINSLFIVERVSRLASNANMRQFPFGVWVRSVPSKVRRHEYVDVNKLFCSGVAHGFPLADRWRCRENQ